MKRQRGMPDVAADGQARVGVRELKNSLSGHLRRVRAGEHILVTDRGRPIARLVPPDLPPGVVRLIREGRLIPPRAGGRMPRPVIPYRRGSKLLSDVVIEQRRK